MTIEILPDEKDDQNFIDSIQRIVNFGVRLTEPDDVFLIKVDHWFDFKWREFSHKIFGALGVWRSPLRVPPFIPDRIVEERHFRKNGKNYEQKSPYKLHFYQTSSENALRKINRRSAVYVWFSGDTINHSKGSLMVYTFGKDFQNSWYVSFTLKTDWQIYKTDNISKAEVKSMMNNDYLALIR